MSNKKVSTAEALTWIADVLDHPDELTAETPRSAIPGWDSLGMLALMARLDEDYELMLEQDESEQMQSVTDILAVLKRGGVLVP
jgi:acyl carrier protein